ncbi:MAG: nitroreductase family protein [Verrucomicrobiota bacterium]|nr:nitroreductase family protein [Verrucomicrobiota bacterium]
MDRKADYPIQPLIINRWSPRAMSGEPLSDGELFPLFEAARWAPSSYNNQPWRILFVRRETPHWHTLFDLLIDFNKGWCQRASALLLFFSRTTFEHNGKPSITHAFDTGAAWENLCLEGNARGLVVHGMQGFDYAKASLLIPPEHEVHAMCAVGKRGQKEDLSEELQAREIPSGRKKIEEFVFEGRVL